MLPDPTCDCPPCRSEAVAMPTVGQWGDASLRVEVSPNGELRIVRPNGSKPRIYVPVDDGYEPLNASGDNSGLVILDP